MTPTPATPGGLDLAQAAHNVLENWREYRGDATTLSYLTRAMDALREAHLRSQVSGGEGAPAGLRERLAALCHEQWSGWMKYLFGKCEILPNAERGDLAVIPEWAVQRWKRQMETPYASLSDKEKDSDRAEADRFLALLPAPAVPDALTWTREKPKVEGWYWIKLYSEPTIARVVKNYGNGGFRFRDPISGADRLLEKAGVTDWLGPIPSPREAPPAPMNQGEVK